MKYPEPLSSCWRLSHNIPYLIGGLTFLVGSFQYYPEINNQNLGGILFCVGGTAFLFADLFEWWKNNRVGCFMYDDVLESYEDTLDDTYDPPHSCLGRFQRASNGLNFFLSAIGSSLYFVGGFYFLPQFNMMETGTWLFIYGSAIIVLSQAWKLVRGGMIGIVLDFSAFNVDLFAGFGGTCYLVGSKLFLSQETTISPEIIASMASDWFVLGGSCFTISGLFMTHRYFCTLNYPNEEKSNKKIPSVDIEINSEPLQIQSEIDLEKTCFTVNKDGYWDPFGQSSDYGGTGDRTYLC